LWPESVVVQGGNATPMYAQPHKATTRTAIHAKTPKDSKANTNT